MPGLSAAALVGEGSRHAFESALESMREVPGPQPPGVLIGRREGVEFPVEFSLAPLAETSAAQVAARFRDLSEVERLEHALQYEASLARVATDTVGDAVVGIDRAGRIVLLNPVGRGESGWTQDEALGEPSARVVRLVDQETGAAAPSPLQAALDGNREVALQPDGALLRRDGSRQPIEASALPIRDAAGNAAGAVMVFHDLSATRTTAMKMSHLAQHDFLTDLPNRVLLHDRLSQALAMADRGSKGALLFVDLDIFKQINDTWATRQRQGPAGSRQAAGGVGARGRYRQPPGGTSSSCCWYAWPIPGCGACRGKAHPRDRGTIPRGGPSPGISPAWASRCSRRTRATAGR